MVQFNFILTEYFKENSKRIAKIIVEMIKNKGIIKYIKVL